MNHGAGRSFSTEAARIAIIVSLSMLLCSQLLLPFGLQEANASPGIGYWIVIAGTYNGGAQDAIDYGCNEVFRILLRLGYTKERIYYMNLSPQDVDHDGIDDRDNCSSNAAFQYAVKTWARSRVSTTETLFIYMFDHGGSEIFCIQNSTANVSVNSTDLQSWLNSLPSNVPKHVVYAACHSGSFINELSSTGRIIITTCRGNESSYVWPKTGPTRWEAFSAPFWRKVQSGHRILRAFNYACKQAKTYTATVLQEQQTPLLDDNADGVGNTCPLPRNGDGYVAIGVRIGSPLSWVFPYIQYLKAAVTIQWPPKSSVTIWATVANDSSLYRVAAWMKPPDWTPPSPDTELLEPDFECFNMNDPDNDGNWTVSIPTVDFTAHASGPSEFKFIITAEETDGDTAVSLQTGVQFTATGQPSPDNINPTVFIERPLEDWTTSGILHIKGVASDDVCIGKVELFVNGKSKATIDLSPASNSYFDFSFDTRTIPNGLATIMVKASDASGNSGLESTDTIAVTVNNVPSDNEDGGGYVIPADKFSLVIPRLGLVSAVMVALAATTFYIKHARCRRKKE